jgi:cold shock CspA family protein
MNGKIKFYNGRYGFIEVEDQDKDVFFHRSEWTDFDLPSVGDRVNFETRKDDQDRLIGIKIIKQ